jgi:hypothetical protein
MERLGGDAATAEALLRAARGEGFSGARVGIAGTCVAAALATRERGSPWRVVPTGRDREFVARRPLAALPLSGALLETLRRLGLTLCRELAALAADEVELAFGAEGLAAWRLSRAEDERWPFRPHPPELPVAEVEFEPGIEGTEPLRFVLPGLVEAVLAGAATRQRLPEHFRLALTTEAGEEHAVEVRPARPTGEVRRILELARLSLEGVRLKGRMRIRAARLEAVGWGAAAADQLDAFRPAAPDPGAVLAALAGVLARWGEEALCQAVPCGAHLPARSAAWQSAGRAAVTQVARPGTAASAETPWPVSSDGLTLCAHRMEPAEEVRVERDVAGRPTAFWREGARTLLRASTAERLSGGWWGERYACELYLAATDAGELWRLAHDVRADSWWLEGWYD